MNKTLDNIYFKLKQKYYKKLGLPQSYKSDLRFYDGLEKILDVPCGQGHFLENNPVSFFGVDLNEIAIDKCKAKGLIVFKEDATQMHFADNSFDGIHCAHFIEHLTPEKLNIFLIEINRILKKGGILVIRTPMNHKLFFDEVSHVRPYTPTAICSLLNAIPLGDPTLYNPSMHFELVDLHYFRRPFFQTFNPIAALPSKFIFSALLRSFGLILNIFRIRHYEKKEYRLVLKKS